MKNRFKVILCTVALTAAMSLSAFAAFSDMPEGDSAAVLEKAVNNGLLTGYNDNTVRPYGLITRAEMATIMARAFGASETADLSGFSDMDKSKWYYNEMAKAVAMEAFKGDGERLNPENNITRQEALIVLKRIFDLPESDTDFISKYPDGSQVADWAKTEVNSIIAGDYVPGNLLRPLEYMTRLEFAEIMDKLVSEYITEPCKITKENLPSGNILVKVGGVTFEDADINQCIFIGDGVKGETEIKNCTTAWVTIRGGQCILNSGKHMHVFAIGNGTSIALQNKPTALDLIKGSFGTARGKGMIYLEANNDVEIADDSE